MKSSGEPRIGVAGDDGPAVDRAVAGIKAAGGVPVRQSAAALVDGAVAVAVVVGEPALLSYVRAGGNAGRPILPVGAGRGVWSIPTDAAEAAGESAVAAAGGDDGPERTASILSVRVDGDRYRALFDVMLVTTEAARISEYSIDGRAGRVADVRADGVVVATPAGTHGYAAAADAPALSPTVDGLAVVPVAPFVTDRDRWVLSDDHLVVGATRDEGPVSLLVDDREVSRLGPDRPVTVTRDGHLSILITPESRPFWPDGATGLEKL